MGRFCQEGINCSTPEPFWTGAVQTVAELRELCSGLPQSQETFPFDATTLVFKVGGKMYALTDIHADPLRLSVKGRPVEGERLRAKYPQIVGGYHLNKRHWITFPLDESLPADLVRPLVTGSYALVVAGLTKVQRAALKL